MIHPVKKSKFLRWRFPDADAVFKLTSDILKNLETKRTVCMSIYKIFKDTPEIPSYICEDYDEGDDDSVYYKPKDCFLI